MYGEIDVHRETFADNLQGWLIDNQVTGMVKTEQGDGYSVWDSEDGTTLRIDVRGATTSIVTITQHDGRVFQTTIATREV